MIIVTQAQLRNKDTEAIILLRNEIKASFVIPYNFPLNTRRGFRTIYFLMKLSQHDMTTVIKDIIVVRHAGINFILNVCDKLEKENDYILDSLRGG